MSQYWCLAHSIHDPMRWYELHGPFDTPADADEVEVDEPGFTFVFRGEAV